GDQDPGAGAPGLYGPDGGGPERAHGGLGPDDPALVGRVLPGPAVFRGRHRPNRIEGVDPMTSATAAPGVSSPARDRIRRVIRREGLPDRVPVEIGIGPWYACRLVGATTVDLVHNNPSP